MSGHSKWTNIKHRKAVQDAKKGKIFTKIIRELVIAARLGGGDVASNPRLRSAIDRALSNNMTKNTLDRAICRGIGNDENHSLKAIVYEGYGPGGTAIMIECLSDNHKRTVSNIRHAFIKNGGNLSTNGSVNYLFTKRGVISYTPDVDENSLMEVALATNIDDIESYDDGTINIYTTLENFSSVKDILDASGFKAKTAEIITIPEIKTSLNIDTAPKFLRLINMLENFDDVHAVHHNGEISSDIATKLRLN